MGWCWDTKDAAEAQDDTEIGACEGCKAAKGGVRFEKQPGASDADVAKARKQWKTAKARRLPDGSKPKTVQAMEALEKSDKETVIKVGRTGNKARPTDMAAARDPKKGSDSEIFFNPDKKGTYGDGVDRDPESSLAHEAFHAYEMSQGQLSPHDHDLREKAEVGATAAENEHRAAKGAPQRAKYGAWPVPQYTPPK